MDVVTDAMPSAPRPVGVTNLDKEEGPPLDLPDKPVLQDERKQKESQREERSESPKDQRKSSKNPKTERPTKTSNKTVFTFMNTSNVHIGANITYNMNMPKREASQDDDDNEEMPPHIKQLKGLNRCTERRDICTVARHLSLDGLKKLHKLLHLKTAQVKNIYEDHKAQGSNEVIYQVLKYWTEVDPNPMVNELCIHLWNKRVRVEGGLDALHELAKNEFS